MNTSYRQKIFVQSSGNADQLQLGLKEQSWSSFSFLLFFSYFSVFSFCRIQNIYSALGRICCYCFLSGFCSNERLFFFLLLLFPLEYDLQTESILDDCTFNSTNSIWKIRASNCTCKQMTNAGTITVQAKWAGHLQVEASVINSLLKAQKCKPKRHSCMNMT